MSSVDLVSSSVDLVSSSVYLVSSSVDLVSSSVDLVSSSVDLVSSSVDLVSSLAKTCWGKMAWIEPRRKPAGGKWPGANQGKLPGENGLD